MSYRKLINGTYLHFNPSFRNITISIIYFIAKTVSAKVVTCRGIKKLLLLDSDHTMKSITHLIQEQPGIIHIVVVTQHINDNGFILIYYSHIIIRFRGIILG